MTATASDREGEQAPTGRAILVTGSTGFVGSAATRALARAGYRVKAGTRRQPEAASRQSDGAEVAPTPCDLSAPAQVRTAVLDTDIVVHTAVADPRTMTQELATLLDAMTSAGVTRLVHLSSIAVYGHREGLVEEHAAPRGKLNAYARAKRQCEEMIASWTATTQRPARSAIALRPGIIYGTGSEFWIEKLARRIECGAWGLFGSHGAGYAALIHIDDVANAIIRCCDRLLSDAAARDPLTIANLVGPEHPTWNDYFSRLAIKIDRAPLREISTAELSRQCRLGTAAKILKRVGLPAPERLTLAPTADELALFATKAQYGRDLARTLLGIEPNISLAAGLARTEVHPRAANAGHGEASRSAQTGDPGIDVRKSEG